MRLLSFPGCGVQRVGFLGLQRGFGALSLAPPPAGKQPVPFLSATTTTPRSLALLSRARLKYSSAPVQAIYLPQPAHTPLVHRDSLLLKPHRFRSVLLQSVQLELSP